jgi:hypothetical protein
MIIPTKYNVNDTFWVPRSIQEYDKEELKFEGETWYKDVLKFKSYAKRKKIAKIEASVNSNGIALVMYYIIDDDGNTNQMASVYTEDQINSYTEEEALVIAQHYANNEEPYHGL